MQTLNLKFPLKAQDRFPSQLPRHDSGSQHSLKLVTFDVISSFSAGLSQLQAASKGCSFGAIPHISCDMLSLKTKTTALSFTETLLAMRKVNGHEYAPLLVAGKLSSFSLLPPENNTVYVQPLSGRQTQHSEVYIL